MKEKSRYLARGVSSDKEDVHNAISKLNKGLFNKSFCKVIPDILNNNRDYALVMHADGVGTKSSLAYIYWKETGDISVWKGIAQDAIVMNTDDLLCVGITDNILLSSIIGRNKFKIPAEVIAEIINGTEEFLELLRSFDVNIYLTGGETADLGDLVKTIVVDASVVAQIKKEKIIDCSNIKGGELIVGLSSFGKANYENEYNSGIGSNGLSAARHELFCKEYKEKYPESYDNEIDEQYVYNGKYKLTDKINEMPLNIGKSALSPTRTYLPVIKEVLKNFKTEIKGIIHCTGGGQTKVLNYVENVKIIKDNLFDIPPLFLLIQESAGMNWKEMFKVFNMGHRMELYVESKIAEDIIEISKSFGVDAKIIGYCETQPLGGKSLTIKSKMGIFNY